VETVWPDDLEGFDLMDGLLSSTLAGREVDGDNDEVPEGASSEQRPVVSANARSFRTQDLEHSVELIEGRLLRSSYQRVGEGDQQASRAIAVDIGVGAAEIAQCPLDPVGARLQEEPLVSGTPTSGGHGQSNFERHVESRGAARELNPTEVVEGIPTRRDEF
jgi:hypothetical protein